LNKDATLKHHGEAAAAGAVVKPVLKEKKDKNE
jgi:hypothetical protein